MWMQKANKNQKKENTRFATSTLSFLIFSRDGVLGRPLSRRAGADAFLQEDDKHVFQAWLRLLLASC